MLIVRLVLVGVELGTEVVEYAIEDCFFCFFKFRQLCLILVFRSFFLLSLMIVTMWSYGWLCEI